ncbi:hypothetical protein BS47DRAFT_1396881 [Hydnum rufescens UP504]|uniref:Uncharacterized protein n=1 Tax=Hydnum rufescens UP504 TaxID=1448309 RepID=A0A9P6ARA9_9AGAM|nr:hypothetical protein BS47DRAFT_1396881 [Hydnum rufescens UP504]
MDEWAKMVTEWEDNKSNPDPEETVKSQAAIHWELVKAECVALTGADALKASPGAFIVSGLELEEVQHHLTNDIARLKGVGTDTQKADVAHRSLLLQKRLVLFQDAQNCFMPEAVGCRLPTSETSTPQSLCLFLPHDLAVPLSLTPSGKHLLTVEAQLQHAQVSDALSELHQSLAVYSHLRMSKIQEATGQRALTQANNLLQKSKAHTDAIAKKY